VTAGCDDPQSGSAIGGLIGTIAGAYVGHANGDLMGGAALGQQLGSQVGGLVGLLNQEQIAYLQQNAPQTLVVIQHNDQIRQQQSSDAPMPLSINDVEQLTAAGVKSDTIIQEMQTSQATYSALDINKAQQAGSAIDPAVVSYMQNHALEQSANN
jgi:hypothetical protein